MHKTLLTGVSLAALAWGSAVQAEGFAVAPKIGSTGLGVDVVSQLKPKLNARVGLHATTISQDLTEDDIDYEVDFELASLSLLLDYHPWAGNFRVTGGLYRNSTDFAFMAEGSTTEQFEIGSATYTGDFKLDGKLNFSPVAPYLGIGWGNAMGQERGWGWNLEAGILFQGEPDFTLEAEGTADDVNTIGNDNLNVSTNPDFQQRLEEERAEVEDSLEDFNIWPVVSFGLSFQF